MLDYRPITLLSGNLMGICPDCSTLIFRRCSLAKINSVRGRCVVTFPQGQQRLIDSPEPCADCHLLAEALPHEKIQ